jgi:hypothetical protein
MRVYIIGNDGITLCREAPAAVNEGEIIVASNEPRDPRFYGLPGGARAPPRAQPRRASSAVAHSLQNRGIAPSQPRPSLRRSSNSSACH